MIIGSGAPTLSRATNSNAMGNVQIRAKLEATRAWWRSDVGNTLGRDMSSLLWWLVARPRTSPTPVKECIPPISRRRASSMLKTRPLWIFLSSRGLAAGTSSFSKRHPNSNLRLRQIIVVHRHGDQSPMAAMKEMASPRAPPPESGRKKHGAVVDSRGIQGGVGILA